MRSRVCALLLALALLPLSGCAEESQTRTLMFIEVFGIDRLDDKFIVTAQVFDAMHSGGSLSSQSSPITHVVTGEGDTISQAVERMSGYTGKDAVYTTNRLTVIGEEVARNNLADVMDYLLRRNESRAGVAVAVARGRASQIVRSTMNGSLRPALDMLHIVLKAQQRETYGRDSERYRALDVMNAFNDPGIDLSLLAVTLKVPDKLASKDSGPGEPASGADETHMQVDGIAYFDGQSLSGYLEGGAYEGYMWLKGSASHEVTVTHDAELGSMSFESLNKDVGVRFDMSGDVPRIVVEITGTAALLEIDEHAMSRIDEAFLTHIEGMYNETIVARCTEAIEDSRVEAGCDIFGFGQKLRFAHSSYWEGVKDVWHEVYKECEVEVRAGMRINRMGQMNWR